MLQFSKSLNKTSDIATSSFDPCIGLGDFGQNFDGVARCMMEREINYLFNNHTINFPKIVNPLFSIYSDSQQIEHLFKSLNLTADAFIDNKDFYVDVKPDLPPIVNFLASNIPSNKIHLIEGQDPASYALHRIFVEKNFGQRIDELHKAFLAIYEKDPTFWKTQNNTEAFFTNLDKTVTEFIRNNTGSTIYGSIYDPLAKISSEYQIKRTQENLNEMEELSKRLDQVRERLEKIETPFGDIPVNFDEASYLFPLAIAGTFSVCAFAYAGSVRIRRSIQDLYYADLPQVAGKIDSYVDRIAPLWLDPKNSNQHKFILLLFLFVPFIIFVVASGLVFYSWFLSNMSTDLPSNIIVYLPMYISTLLSPDQSDTQQLMDQVIYNHFDWPIFISGVNQHPTIRNLISMDLIQTNLWNIDILRPVQLPLYSVLQNLKGPYNQFGVLLLTVILFIEENDLLFSISYLVLYIISFILLVWSYKITLCAYVRYSNTSNTIYKHFRKLFE